MSSADKISDAEVEAAARSMARSYWNRLNAGDSGFAKAKYPNGIDQYEAEQFPLYLNDARAALEAAAATRRAQSVIVGDGVAHAFRNADASDWQHLFAVLPDTGRGRFWKAVMTEARTAINAEVDGPKPS
tara:strand:+ start:3056 stop:3445 length:390 start_codon:yes stop_codon:yes gene_type:complete